MLTFKIVYNLLWECGGNLTVVNYYNKINK